MFAAVALAISLVGPVQAEPSVSEPVVPRTVPSEEVVRPMTKGDEAGVFRMPDLPLDYLDALGEVLIVVDQLGTTLSAVNDLVGALLP